MYMREVCLLNNLKEINVDEASLTTVTVSATETEVIF